MPKITKRKSDVLSPWVTLVTTSIDWEDERGVQIYHAVQQADYVSMLAITSDGQVPLLRQFRPGCSDYTLELPGGMLEKGESIENCARRELLEETGLVAGKLNKLATLWPDPGRLTNRLHCFLMTEVQPTNLTWVPESGLEQKSICLSELMELTASGQLHNAHHVAIIGLALTSGLLDPIAFT